MARAQGARAQMALAFETTYGTPPASGYTRMPFASATLGAEQPLLNSELLGYGRDPLPPIKDAVTSDGDVVVPIDAQGFGFWLKAAFGGPTTTGAQAPYAHEFRSGAWDLPSMSIETGMPEVPRYAMYSGCVLDQLSWQMQRSGLLTATARLVAQGETVGATTAAFGAPSEPPVTLDLQRFGHFNGSITRNGTALGCTGRRRHGRAARRLPRRGRIFRRRSHQLLGGETRMSNRDTLFEQTLQAFRDHGITAAIGVWFTFIAGLATAVTRKAFTNEALLHKLEQ